MLVQFLLESGYDLLIWYSACDLIGPVPPLVFGQTPHNDSRLLLDILGKANLFVANVQMRVEPGLRKDTAKFVKPISQFLWGMDECRYPIGNLREHFPLCLVHIGHANLKDIAPAATLAILDGNLTGGLHVPDLQVIEHREVALLNFRQCVPACLFSKT